MITGASEPLSDLKYEILILKSSFVSSSRSSTVGFLAGWAKSADVEDNRINPRISPVRIRDTPGDPVNASEQDWNKRDETFHM